MPLFSIMPLHDGRPLLIFWVQVFLKFVYCSVSIYKLFWIITTKYTYHTIFILNVSNISQPIFNNFAMFVEMKVCTAKYIYSTFSKFLHLPQALEFKRRVVITCFLYLEYLIFEPLTIN